jgi:hypothetical protein
MVQLIDTPGFDDTTRSDDQVLKDLAAWLSFAFKGGFRLNGMIYLHTIGETRMKGSHMTNLRMFKEMTGLDNMGSVVLVTTMWDRTDRELGKKRELELMETDKFWQPMIKNGSRVQRFMNDRPSALKIIGTLVDQHRKFVPKLQHEMSVEGKDLDQTNAGKAVNAKIIEQKEKHEQEKKDMEKQMEKALRENDMKYTQEILDAQEMNTKQMMQLEQAQKELKVSNERLLKEKEEQIERARQEMIELKANVAKQGEEHALEIEKRNTREKELQANMEEQAANTEALIDRYAEGAAQMILGLNEGYKSIIEEQELRNKERLGRMAALQQTMKGAPPPYSASNQPPQNDRPMPPQPMYQQPMYQPPPQVIYQQAPANDALTTGAAMGVGGTMLGLAALAPAAAVCVVM